MARTEVDVLTSRPDVSATLALSSAPDFWVFFAGTTVTYTRITIAIRTYHNTFSVAQSKKHVNMLTSRY